MSRASDLPKGLVEQILVALLQARGLDDLDTVAPGEEVPTHLEKSPGAKTHRDRAIRRRRHDLPGMEGEGGRVPGRIPPEAPDDVDRIFVEDTERFSGKAGHGDDRVSCERHILELRRLDPADREKAQERAIALTGIMPDEIGAGAKQQAIRLDRPPLTRTLPRFAR